MKLSDEKTANEDRRLRCVASPRCPKRVRMRGMCNAHYLHWLDVRERDTDYIGGSYVDSQPTVDHIARLRASGLGWAGIANITGIGRRQLRTIGSGERAKVHPYTEKRILAVPITSHENHRPSALISPVGTMRRLRALVAIGYTNEELSTGLGMALAPVREIMLGRGQYVQAATAREVERLFHDWQMKVPADSTAARRARLRAKRRGWAPPLAWEEDEIDNPSARPLTRRTVPDDWYQEYLDLKALGLNEGQVAARMGIHQSTLSKRISRRAA